MAGKIRRALNDGVVASMMVYGLKEVVSASYEFSEKTGYDVVTYGLPTLTAIAGIPFIYMAVRAFDRDVARNPNSTLNRILDNFTYL